MKFRLTLSFFLILYFCGFTQDDPEKPAKQKQYIAEVLVGLSDPTSAFGSSDFDNEEAGLAGNGGFLFLSYGPLYNKRVGYEIALSASVNPFVKEVDELLSSAQVPSGYDYDYKTGQWINICFMAGPRLSLPVKRFALDLRLLGGLMLSDEPFIVQSYYRNGYLIYELKEGYGDGVTVAIQTGLGIRYSISHHIDIKLSAHYITGKPNIKSKFHMYKDACYENLREQEYKQPVSLLNYGIGLVFHFDERK
jgi:hypothetical protein